MLAGRRALHCACSIIALALGFSSPAWSSDTGDTAQSSSQQDQPGDQNQEHILVIGQRAIVDSLKDVPVEQEYDQDRVSSYDVSTVGDVIDTVRQENGDSQPSILVNGQPVPDTADINDIPAEAIARVEVLPRGSAQKVGGAIGQRVYNVILHPSVKSATLTGSYEFATEGGWSNTRGEALLTYIKGQDRINLTLRGADSGALFESERDVMPRSEYVPHSPIGNIIPVSGTEIDPVLSALAGQPVSVVALPAGNSQPTLADVLAGANQINPSFQEFHRTLRGPSHPYNLAIAGNKTLAPWLSLSFNGNVDWTKSIYSSGVPSARFLIPASNPYSPFSTSVYLALNDPSRTLHSVSDSTNVSLSSTLNATLGSWHATVNGRWTQRDRTYTSEFSDPLSGNNTVAPGTDPFDSSLAATIPIDTLRSHSKNSRGDLAVDAEGPLFDLPTGPLRGRVDAAADWEGYDATDAAGSRTFRRHQYGIKAALMMALTSRDRFLPVLGNSDIALEYGTADLGRYGTLEHHAFTLNWQPVSVLQLTASEVRDQRAIAPELLAAPELIVPNVPYFDPLTGQTADVTIIEGGAGALQSEDLRTRSLTVSAYPLSKYKLHLEADYNVNDLRNQVGALPPPSSAVMEAFPDRFQRDASGTLIVVDNRSVNFARQRDKELRLGINFEIPLSQPASAQAGRAGPTRRRSPPLKLQVNASHTFLLESTTTIRQGLPQIDLLKGGAIGIGGGRQRDSSFVEVALTKGATGVRFAARRRGPSYLVTGTMAAPDLLTFGSLFTIDARAFADLHQLFPKSSLAKNTRVTVAIENLTDERQRVTNAEGVTPQAFDPFRRDPLGRTVRLELRKVF